MKQCFISGIEHSIITQVFSYGLGLNLKQKLHKLFLIVVTGKAPQSVCPHKSCSCASDAALLSFGVTFLC